VTEGDIEVDAQAIATGHAWHYTQMNHGIGGSRSAERQNRQTQAVADGDAVRQWGWRKGERGRKAAPLKR